MRFTIIISAVLHVSAVMLAYVALPDFRKNDVIEIIVPISVLSEAELAEEISVPETTKEEPPAEEELQQEPEETPPPVVEEKAPEVEEQPVEEVPPPPPPLEEEKPEEEVKEEEPEEKPEEPPVEEEKKPEPPKKEPPKEEDPLDLDSLESSLVDLTPDQQERTRPREGAVGERNQERFGLGDRLSATEEAKIKAYITEKCWNTSQFSGAPEPWKYRVEVVFSLNPDGSLLSGPRVKNALQIAASGDPFWRVAENSVVTAIEKCAPQFGSFLPPEKYEAWKDFEIGFQLPRY